MRGSRVESRRSGERFLEADGYAHSHNTAFYHDMIGENAENGGLPLIGYLPIKR